MILKRIIFSYFILSLMILAVSCRVNSGDGSAVGPEDESNKPTIIIKVNQPELSETYHPGGTLQIRWDIDISNPAVDVVLYKKSSQIFILAENTKFQDGYMRWDIPESIPDSRHYRILVQNHVKPVEHAYSDYFYILSD